MLQNAESWLRHAYYLPNSLKKKRHFFQEKEKTDLIKFPSVHKQTFDFHFQSINRGLFGLSHSRKTGHSWSDDRFQLNSCHYCESDFVYLTEKDTNSCLLVNLACKCFLVGLTAFSESVFNCFSAWCVWSVHCGNMSNVTAAHTQWGII